MEIVSTVMTVVTAVFAAIIGIAAIFGIFIGWKRCLIGLCRTIVAGLLAFAAIKIFCMIVPADKLWGTIIFPLTANFSELNEQLTFVYESNAVQVMSGSIIYTIVLPFFFLPVFAIFDSLLLIPAHFIGKALGIYASRAEKKEVKRQRREDKIARKLEKKARKLEEEELGDRVLTEEEKAEELKKEYEELEKEADYDQRSKELAYNIFNKVGGFLIRGVTTTIIMLLTILPVTGLMYTLTDGASGLVNTAADLDVKISSASPNQVVLNHTITDSEGYYNFDEISVLVDETLAPVCDNFFLKLSYCAPMKALYTGIGGSSDSEGKFRNEITQLFDLATNVIYLAVDFEKYGDDQKNAVNGILSYISKSELHSAAAADLISSTCKDLKEDSTKLNEYIPEEKADEIKTIVNPVIDIFANTTAESIRKDVNTINDILIAVIDYKIPYEIAQAITTESNDNLIRALANEDFLYRLISDIYNNEDFHDLIAPVINFSFLMISRQFDADIKEVDVASNLDNLSDDNLHYEAKVLSSILLDAVDVIDTIPDIMGSGETAGAIQSANMASFGRLLDDAMDSLFIGENIKDLFVLILDSEVFDNMRGVADIIKKHMDDEDLNMENLLTAVQQFTGILEKYESSNGHSDMTELANTLRKLSSSFDPTTSAIIKEVINDSSVLNMGMISGGSEATTANTQKLLNVFVDQLASGNLSDEEFEKEAKAVDYAMQLINASTSSESSVKDVYTDEAGMQEMISTMAESKIASESIKAIAYDDAGNLTPDALELSEGLDDNDKDTLKNECEKYYKEKAAEENADFETIDKNLKAIAAVLGEDISEDLSSWKAELGLNDQQNENENGN